MLFRSTQANTACVSENSGKLALVTFHLTPVISLKQSLVFLSVRVKATYFVSRKTAEHTLGDLLISIVVKDIGWNTVSLECPNGGWPITMTVYETDHIYMSSHILNIMFSRCRVLLLWSVSPNEASPNENDARTRVGVQYVGQDERDGL